MKSPVNESIRKHSLPAQDKQIMRSAEKVSRTFGLSEIGPSPKDTKQFTMNSPSGSKLGKPPMMAVKKQPSSANKDQQASFLSLFKKQQIKADSTQ
jgi:hypothetical protein